MINKVYELKNFNKKINFFLLYGKNSGHIDEVVDSHLKPNFSKNISYYEESEVINNLDIFKEDVLNQSFFDADKLIIISRTSDKILKIIEDIIEKKIDDLVIILKTGILDKKSKLRNFFEKNSETIIVPFYEDTDQTLLMIAQNFFKERKIKISSQNINLIIEKSRGDRIFLKNELEKIGNFLHKKNTIEAEEIIKLTNLSENYEISELVDQCLLKNKKKTVHILNENNLSIEDNIIILRTFQFKLKRLRILKKNINDKKNLDSIISSYKPPIFWKDKDLIKQQLKIWSFDDLNKLLKQINNLEILVKKKAQVSNLLTCNFILERLGIVNN